MLDVWCRKTLYSVFIGAVVPAPAADGDRLADALGKVRGDEKSRAILVFGLGAGVTELPDAEPAKHMEACWKHEFSGRSGLRLRDHGLDDLRVSRSGD